MKQKLKKKIARSVLGIGKIQEQNGYDKVIGYFIID